MRPYEGWILWDSIFKNKIVALTSSGTGTYPKSDSEKNVWGKLNEAFHHFLPISPLHFISTKPGFWVGTRFVTTKKGHFFMALRVTDTRVFGTWYLFYHYLANSMPQLLFDHLCNMENNKMKIDVYNIFLFTKNYEHLRLPPPISLFYTIMRFQYLTHYFVK